MTVKSDKRRLTKPGPERKEYTAQKGPKKTPYPPCKELKPGEQNRTDFQPGRVSCLRSWLPLPPSAAADSRGPVKEG